MGILSHPGEVRARVARSEWRAAREKVPDLSRHSPLVLADQAHAAVLVFLAAAARTGIVAAHPLVAIADRFGFLVPRLRAGDGGVGRVAGSGFVNRGPDRPHRFLKTYVVLHAEHAVGDLVLHHVPHALEFPHALALVLGLGVDLGIT